MCVWWQFFFQAIVDSDPEYVIRRVESSRYAVNSDVRQMYDRALTLVGPTSVSFITVFVRYRGV